MAEMSPLHRVIDAARWDAERLLGRLIILVHAAFLDVGFVLHAGSVGKAGRVRRRAGRTASTLSLVYAAPRRRDAAVPLHMRAHDMHIVFNVCVPRFAKDPRPGTHWVCVDTRAVAPLLSCGLDDTAHALADDGACGVAVLWRELTEKLCRSTLVAVCPGNDALLSLSVDVLLDIFERLNGLDILRVASTCAGLGRLVADHDSELWKNRYKPLFWRRWEWVDNSSAMADDSSGTTWMELWRKETQRLHGSSGTTWMELWCKEKQRLHERAKFGEYIREERRKNFLRYRSRSTGQ